MKKYLSFIEQLKNRFFKDNVSAQAAQLTYFLLLSFFPFMMFLLTILSYTPITKKEVIIRIGNIFPADLRLIITTILNEIAENRSSTLLSISVIIALWSASRGILAIVKSLNISYDLHETRSFLFLRITSLIYTVIFAVIITLTFLLLIFGNKLLALATAYFTISPDVLENLKVIRFLIPLSILFLFFIIIYNASPNRKISFKEVLPGAIFASLGWFIVSLSFSFYIDNFSNFSYMYGSLAGIVVLLLWIYINSNIILIGGEINALLVSLKNNVMVRSKKPTQ